MSKPEDYKHQDHKPNVYNMPSGMAFLPNLAEGLTRHYGDQLTDALILLPTRRAVAGLREAFADIAKSKGISATLLPRMKPLADINPDEPPFEPGELAGQIAPAMPAMQRRFEMAKLVARYHRRAADLPLDPAAALMLADPLLAILDDAAMEEVSLVESEEWKHILAESAQHFQHAATLYQIIQDYWPARLKELGLLEGQARKVALLRALTQSWQDSPPDYPVIIAGSTGTLKATAALMACTANLPQGMVVLPGLQMTTDPQWDTIDVQHPQYSLKRFVERLDIDRADVTDWREVLGIKPNAKRSVDLRRLVMSEALVAVDKTSDWLRRIETLKNNHGEDIFKHAMEGVSLITAPNDEDEALSIALIMRDVLREDDKTAALVTPDQNLAYRVKSRLRRWDIEIEMSQGASLARSPIGTFLIAILGLAQDIDDPLALSALCHHPLFGLGEGEGIARAQWEALEIKHYRGLRPNFDEAKMPALIARLREGVSSLMDITSGVSVDIWAERLAQTAETLARSDTASGAQRLWQGQAGAQAHHLLTNLIRHGADLPETDAKGMQRLLARMMQNTTLRPSGGPLNRLSILGPLEARLISPDLVILGGLNEGVWPARPSVDPFLSRPMRKELQLSLPERRYGLAAHDFAELAANPNVIMTRALRSDNGPAVASRWIWRLQTLLKGALGEQEAADILSGSDHYLGWAQALDYVPPQDVRPASPPAPKPPTAERWAYARRRSISITQVKNWIRDPYSIYAKHVLGLKPLEPLDAPQDARHFGNALHKAIEDFTAQAARPFSIAQQDEFISCLNAAFEAEGYAPELIRHEAGRFENIAADMINWLVSRNKDGFDIIGNEVKASYHFDDINFTLRGTADLIERNPNGLAFFDFKSGTPADAKEVGAGFDPQLPLSAFLGAEGAFEQLPKADSVQLGYVRVKGSNNSFAVKYISGPEGMVDRKPAKDAMTLAAEAAQTLRDLIAEFDKPETAYHSQPRIKYQNKYGDFDHLARRAEWAGLIDNQDDAS